MDAARSQVDLQTAEKQVDQLVVSLRELLSFLGEIKSPESVSLAQAAGLIDKCKSTSSVLAALKTGSSDESASKDLDEVLEALDLIFAQSPFDDLPDITNVLDNLWPNDASLAFEDEAISLEQAHAAIIRGHGLPLARNSGTEALICQRPANVRRVLILILEDCVGAKPNRWLRALA